jgi:hypothetical protein
VIETKGDHIVESGADKLDSLSTRAAAKGGLAGKLAGELADDASFLRKLKPSQVVARARGHAPRDQEPGTGAPRAPGGPQLDSRGAAGRAGGPNPFLVAGVAFAVGTVLAKLIDWRGHAHPKR